MASNGIKDRVAIVGMGCTAFGEHWDKGPEDLLIDAAQEAYRSAGVSPEQVDAYWLGTMGSGISGLMLSEALKLDYKPVTRLENMCATGSEAMRNAAYAVASGAYDLVMAIGVEKLKDSGYSGLVGTNPPNDGTLSSMTAPARPRAAGGHADAPARALEARLRRLALPRVPDGASAAPARVRQVRRRRSDGGGTLRRHVVPGGDLHARPPGLFAAAAGGGRLRRLRRRCASGPRSR